MQIPSFLLRKLYVKGSLTNVDNGFQFKIKNSLSPGTAIAIEPFKVDDKEYPLEKTIIESGDVKVKASEISENNPFTIKVGIEVVVTVEGEQLSPGDHKIDIAIKTKEAGLLKFDVKDGI